MISHVLAAKRGIGNRPPGGGTEKSTDENAHTTSLLAVLPMITPNNYENPMKYRAQNSKLRVNVADACE
jgi:hypothetical protein